MTTVADQPQVIQPSPPKEQRVRSRQNTKRGEKRNDNPIKDWLSLAKSHQEKPDDNVSRPVEQQIVLRSPSWADECETDVNEADTSDDFGTPSSSLYDVSRDESLIQGTSPEPHDVDDVYELPPSGQITHPRPATCDAEADRMYSLPAPRPSVANGVPTAQKARQINNNNKRQGATRSTKGNDSNVTTGKLAQNSNGKSNVNGNGTKPKVKPNPSKRGKSYAKVASEGEWLKVKADSGKKRKFEKVSPKLTFPLKGSASKTVRDVYLQGLDIEDGQTPEDVIDSVRAFCNKNGITPVFISVIPVKYDCTRTGCRLTVKVEDFERVIEESFWPDLITVREWTPRNRDNRQNNGGNGRDQSDDDN